MIDETGYKAKDTGRDVGRGKYTGNSDMEMLEHMMDSYKATMTEYANLMPESERDRLYNVGLALYFSLMKGVITQDYKLFYNVLDAATHYHLEKSGLAGVAGLAGVVNRLNGELGAKEQGLEAGDGTPELRALRKYSGETIMGVKK